MVLDMAVSFFSGLGASVICASPVEWGIHKYILHATPKNRRKSKFLSTAAHSHNDKHHGAYRGPAHYYRDVTNENEIIHFSKGDVATIAGCSAVVGGMMDAAYSILAQKDLTPNSNDAAFVLGVVAGTMGCYGCYEFTHNYMHVIGERRLKINRVLGDEIQGGREKRDGNLRFSKPLLDDLCNEIELQVDGNIRKRKESFYFEDFLVERLEDQIGYNIGREGTARPNMAVNSDDALEVLHVTVDSLLEREREYRGSLNGKEKVKDWIDRRIQRTLRASSLFQYLDHHHFLHHYKYGKNLNVAFPVADFIFGTKENSSRATLEQNKRYWLCPNSPDSELFVAREEVKKPALVFS